MPISISTRNACQAATAVLLTVVLTHFFHMERSYWATLTAMFLVTQTFGDSLKKAFDRVMMTIIGCIVGTLLYYWLMDFPSIILVILLACTFLSTYYLSTSYALSTFFITILVVFVFALIAQWNINFLKARIIETMIGAAVVVLTTAVILPISAKQTLRARLPEFLDRTLIGVNNIFFILNGEVKKIKKIKLIITYQEMKTTVLAARYENFFSSYSKQSLDQLLLQLRMLVHYVNSARDIANNLSPGTYLTLIHPDLANINQTIAENFASLTQQLLHPDKPGNFTSLEPLREKLRKKVTLSLQTQTTSPSDWFQCYTLIYSLRRINEILHDLIQTTSSPDEKKS